MGEKALKPIEKEENRRCEGKCLTQRKIKDDEEGKMAPAEDKSMENGVGYSEIRREECRKENIMKDYKQKRGEGMYQLQTEIKHYKKEIHWWKEDGYVGVKMEAKLEPEDVVEGTAVKGGQDGLLVTNAKNCNPKAAVVRGHLLNHDLGGRAIDANL